MLLESIQALELMKRALLVLMSLNQATQFGLSFQ